VLTANKQRFRQIYREFLERPNGDYAELGQGHVSSHEGVDVDVWRADIRRQARQDRIRVITSRDGSGGVRDAQPQDSRDQARRASRPSHARLCAEHQLSDL
jgi:hypothetical protein